MYEVQSTKYKVRSILRCKRLETRNLPGGRQARLSALCYEIRVVYEFSLLHSSIRVQRSILKKVSSS